TVAIDKSLPYKLFAEVLYSTKAAGVRELAIAARGKQLGVVPMTVPDKSAKSDVSAGSTGLLQLKVELTKDKVTLWSVSGLEGTSGAPKLIAARTEMAKLTAALAEIVKRRFAVRRADADRSIIVMVSGGTPMQDILDVLVAVRS